MNWQKIGMRAFAGVCFAHAAYGLITGTLRFPGGQGAPTGGGWVTLSDDPGAFWFVMAGSVIFGICALVAKFDD